MSAFKYPDSLVNSVFPEISDSDRHALENDYLDFLSEEQAEVALHKDGPFMVIAGPGSGKTETMVRRASILIDFHKVSPENIVLTTFTEKAAASLVSRLKTQIKEPHAIEKLTVSTIHSFCLQLLEDFGVEFGLFKRSLRVLDEHKQSLFVYTRSKELGLGSRPDPKDIAEVIKFYNNFQEKGIKYNDFVNHVESDPEAGEGLKFALQTYPKYLELLEENNALDFSTILLKALQLLEIDEAAQKVRNKYKYLIIDEYQDTNPLQDIILRKIAEPSNNIAIIGDDDQSIYRFRGATVSNFLSFPDKYKNVTKKVISHNRRSSTEIVELSKKIVNKIPDEAKTEKEIYTENPQFQELSIQEYETSQGELKGIVDKIQTMKDSGIIKHWSDVAILAYSISSIFPGLQAEFESRGIPYVTKGDKSYLDEDAVVALINIIEFITKKEGSITNFERVTAPIFNCLNPKTVDFLESYSSEEDVTGINPGDILIESPYDKERLEKLIDRRRDFQANKYKEYSDLIDFSFKIFEDLETFKFIQTLDELEGNRVLSQIGKFTSLLNDFSNETGSKAFSKFKEFLRRIVGKSIDTPRPDDEEDAVVLQTIHQSKGLEYPVVFMPGLTARRFPGYRKDDDSMPTDPNLYKFWKPNPEIENKDIDFRRLMYVAVTRAEKLVYLSYFKKITRNERRSPYIDELVEEDKLPVVEADQMPDSPILSKGPRPKDKLIISSSHLQYYMYCPTRFKFNLKHNIEAPHRGYFAFGSSVHSMIEEMTNTIKRNGLESVTEDQAKQVFEDNWIKFGFENISAEERQKESALKYFLGFCEKHVPLMSKIAESEKKFTLEEDNFILTGKIDAIINDADNITVVDFKSGKKDKFQVEPESTFVENQANIYVEATERLGMAENSEFYLHFLGEDQTDAEGFKKAIPVSKDSRAKVMNSLAETADRIQANDFAPIGEDHRPQRCRHCEYRKICPYRLKAAS